MSRPLTMQDIDDLLSMPLGETANDPGDETSGAPSPRSADYPAWLDAKTFERALAELPGVLPDSDEETEENEP